MARALHAAGGDGGVGSCSSIKGLRDRDLLAGEPDADDRRNRRLSLTPEGQALLQRVQGNLDAVA